MCLQEAVTEFRLCFGGLKEGLRKQWFVWMKKSVSSVAQSCPTLWDPVHWSTPGLLSTSNSQSLLKLISIESMMPSNHLILCRPILLPLSIFPNIRSFPVSELFAPCGQNIGVSASTSVLPMNIQDWFPLGWTVGSPCSPRDSQEHLKSINSLVLSLLYSPTLTSIHDYWKNHRFD